MQDARAMQFPQTGFSGVIAGEYALRIEFGQRLQRSRLGGGVREGCEHQAAAVEIGRACRFKTRSNEVSPPRGG